MPEVTHDCPRDGETVTLCCGRSPFELPRSDRMTLDSALVTCRRDTDSDTAFRAAHQGHDVGWRHEDGRLYSATCHDCDVRYAAPENADCCEHPTTDHDQHGCTVDVSTNSRVYERCHEGKADA